MKLLFKIILPAKYFGRKNNIYMKFEKKIQKPSDSERNSKLLACDNRHGKNVIFMSQNNICH